MARAKKEAALTPEERLQAALVPDWEWPYKLPENWCWVKLVESFDNHTDSKKKIKQKDYLMKGKLAVVDQGQELIGGYTNDVEKSYSGTLPVVIFGDHTRCIKFVDFPFAQGADGVKVLRPKPFYLPKAFYYALQSVNIPNLGYRRHFPLFNKFSIPLPPFAEQQRIVDRIESLFAKLDEAKEKAQAVADSFETRKAAILHKAFTGELTAKWREEHGVRMESWEQCSLSDVCTVNPKKADTKDLPDELEVSFFPMPALSEIYGEITDPQTRLLKEVRSGFTNFSEGDVVFAKITPCMENGKSAVVGKLVNDIGYGTTEFFVLRCSDRLYNRFLYHLVRDKLFRDKAKAVMAGAVGQQRVPKRYLETYKLNLPKFNEQREIVRILDGSFAKEQQTKEAAEAVLDQINLMKKSILARAFRGELGTNDPNEESAVELLRQVIEQEDGDVIRPKAKAKRIAIPAEIKPLLSGANEEAIVKLLLKAAPQSVSTQTVMSISKKKFELMDALRNLEKKQIVSKSDSGEYSLVR